MALPSQISIALSQNQEVAPDSVVIIELLGGPRGKARPRHARLANGVVVTHSDPRTRSYERDLRWAAARAMDGRAPLEGPLSVLIEAFFPIPQSWSGKKQRAAFAGEIRPTITPDWNNLAGPLDALNTVVWVDDRQIVKGTVIKRYSDRPRLVVSVWPTLTVSSGMQPSEKRREVVTPAVQRLLFDRSCR